MLERGCREKKRTMSGTDADSPMQFVLKLEPPWSSDEDPPDQPSAVYSTAQPVSDNASGSLLSLNTSRVCQRCSSTFVLVSSLELHLASVHGEKLPMVLPGSSELDRHATKKVDNADLGEKIANHSKRKTPRRRKSVGNDACVREQEAVNHRKRKTAKRRQKVDDTNSGVRNKKANRHWVCDTCLKPFPSRTHLQRHMEVHTEFRPFACPECGKMFKSPGRLKDHQVLHSEDKVDIDFSVYRIASCNSI